MLKFSSYRIFNFILKNPSLNFYKYFHANFIFNRKPTFDLPLIPHYLNILTPNLINNNHKQGKLKFNKILFGIL